MRSFNARDGTHDILIRHKVVKNIEIPANLHVHEDAFIKKWILEKGHKVIATYAPYCIHFKPVEDWALRNSVSSAALGIKHGFLRYPRLYHLYSVVHWLIAFLFSIPLNSQARERIPDKVYSSTMRHTTHSRNLPYPGDICKRIRHPLAYYRKKLKIVKSEISV
jgi:hypothetical protein